MPTYEYDCPKCGRFQYEQRITDPALETCPHCGSPVRRLISRNIGIIFKGSGFHITDYRSEDYKRKVKEEEKESSPAGASSTSTK